MRRRVQQFAERFGYRPSAKIRELMAQVRADRGPRAQGCFGLISLYHTPRPWEEVRHHTRIYENMYRRAQELGYRLDPIWLRQPGMTYRRLRAILDTRGIQGLACFGSPELDADFPAELDHYAIVTVGVSIRTPLHRVTAHFYNDITTALSKVHALGYSRPGLILSRRGDVRSAHMYSSGYLGWCHRVLGTAAPLPILPLVRIEEEPVMRWLTLHRPDVVVIAHGHEALTDLAALLRRRKISVPAELGVVAVTHLLEDTPFSGMQQNQVLMGGWLVEALVARVMNRDFGIPQNPRIEMVESEWVEGTTLRKRAKPRPAAKRRGA